MRFIFQRILPAVICIMWSTAACASEEISGVPYKVRIEGLNDGTSVREIKDFTLTYRLSDRPPATAGQLRRRVEGDLPRIETVLESRGYFDYEVAADVDTVSDPARVTFMIHPGKVYRYRSIRLKFLDSPDPVLEKIKPGIRKNRRAVAVFAFEEQQRIIEEIQRRGYPFPALERRQVTLDREAKRIDLDLEFRVGPRAVYGEMQVEGHETLKDKYFKRQTPWRPGDPYDVRQLERFEKKLLSSGLFATARVEPVDDLEVTNSVPVQITVRERDKRTIRAGVSYSDIGFGGKVLWEHRNLFGSGERLETSVNWSEIEVGAKASLLRPGFLGAHQSLILDLDVAYETPDAYDARNLRASSIMVRDFLEEIQGGLGIGYKYSLVEQLASSERYGHVFFPLHVIFDYRDDRLNPVKGAHVLGRTAYYQDTLASDSFLKSMAEGRHYQMFWKRYRLSSALRLTLGHIDGTDINNVPADERFYAGGGGSIRGYEYQAVGPSAAGVPLGGDNLIEFSMEARLQPGDTFGYVAFLDGGTVYNSLISSSARDMRYGAGVGLRWFTGIGPLRVDFAYPLNPDTTQVERVQFYISLGQAF